MRRTDREISALLRAAGHVEEARQLLQGVTGSAGRYRESLKAVADELAAEAVAGKLTIANDLEQNYGHG